MSRAAADTEPRFKPELYRSYLRILARASLWAMGPLRAKMDPSDIVQDALLQALVAMPQFKGTTEEEFLAWLRTVLQNKMKDTVRALMAQKRDPRLEQALGDTLNQASIQLVNFARQTSPIQHVLRDERLRSLAGALDALPEDQRAAIELRYVLEYSVKEAAQAMNRSEHSVAGLARRGLETLRETLDPNGATAA